MSHKLKQQEAEELRSEINKVLKCSKSPPRPHITKAEYKAIQQLKKDKSRIILTADKGVAMVLMDRKDYLDKAKNQLEQPAYKKLASDPTNK